jgi:hypothetical protein
MDDATQARGLDRLDPRGQPAPVRFDTKIAILLREDLEPWQRLNVTAFLASGIAALDPELIGEPYADAAARRTSDVPAAGARLRGLEGEPHGGAPARAGVGPEGGGLHDGHVRHRSRRGQPGRRPAVGRADLDLVRIALHGPKNAVDKVMKGAHLHP